MGVLTFLTGVLTGRSLFPKVVVRQVTATEHLPILSDAPDRDLMHEIINRWKTPPSNGVPDIPLADVSLPTHYSLKTARSRPILFEIGDLVRVEGGESNDQIVAIRKGLFGTETFYQTQSDSLWRVARDLDHVPPVNPSEAPPQNSSFRGGKK